MEETKGSSADWVRSNVQGILDSISVHNIEKKSISVISSLGVEDVVHIYKRMRTIREMDRLLEKEYGKGSVRGFCHLSVGQEVIYAALESVMKDDLAVSSYRCHGIAHVTGCSVQEIMGEMLGKQAGVCKGKGGSMHLYNRNFFGGHGIVGAQVPLGLGIAYALKYRSIQESRKGMQVCYAFYGDGAANQGQVWESFNMAMIWNLPIVFVCENNRYGMWTPVESVSPDNSFYTRGGAMPGIRISHDNVFGLISVFRHAREHALEHGPIIIQIDTYRLCGHSTVDQTEFYRPQEEVNIETERDPMRAIESMLMKFYSEKDLRVLKSSIRRQVGESLEAARKSRDTDSAELFTDILL